MFLTILVLFTVNIIALSISLVLRKYLLSMILTTISVLVFLWFFTSVPIRIGLIKLPIIELVKIRATTDDDYPDHRVYEKGGVIEFISNKNLEEFDIRTKYLLRLIGTGKPDLSYQDIYKDEEFVTTIESNSIFLKEKINDRYVYEAVFDIEIPTSEMTDTIYCKVFLVQMLTTIFGTNEICIPRDSLLLIARKDSLNVDAEQVAQ